MCENMSAKKEIYFWKALRYPNLFYKQEFVMPISYYLINGSTIA